MRYCNDNRIPVELTQDTLTTLGNQRRHQEISNDTREHVEPPRDTLMILGYQWIHQEIL